MAEASQAARLPDWRDSAPFKAQTALVSIGAARLLVALKLGTGIASGA